MKTITRLAAVSLVATAGIGLAGATSAWAASGISPATRYATARVQGISNIRCSRTNPCRRVIGVIPPGTPSKPSMNPAISGQFGGWQHRPIGIPRQR